MAISEDVGSVATLWRFPVKSMAGEQLHEVEVTERGVLAYRAYAPYRKGHWQGREREVCEALP